MKNWSETKLIVIISLVAMAIRIYLALSSFCIAADGAGYLEMARAFAAGHPGRALSSVFSPLYPFLISLGYRIVANWELTGELISIIFGTLTIPLLYLLVREIYGRREIAVGAAALAAIHPELSDYSASVRTEAGFICLSIAALYLFVAGVGRRRPLRIVGAGAVGGLAYLYRAEGIGLLPVCIAILFVGVPVWRQWNLAAAVRWAVLFALTFVAVASPYLVYLRQAVGHWTVSRELNFAAAQSVMELARNKTVWLNLQRSGNTALLASLLTDPHTYFVKLGYDLMISPYYFIQAISPPVAILLAVGLWIRGRGLFLSFGESLLALEVGFYFVGFAFFNTGPRFMVHLIPYTFGWAILGLEAAMLGVERIGVGARKVPAAAIAVALALVLLPRTLWPPGYDQRGLRYAAADVRRLGLSARAVVAPDGRFAFYVGAKFVELPEDQQSDMCQWLEGKREAELVMLSEKDERRWPRNAPCLRFIKRYPRSGKRYYDLFSVTR